MSDDENIEDSISVGGLFSLLSIKNHLESIDFEESTTVLLTIDTEVLNDLGQKIDEITKENHVLWLPQSDQPLIALAGSAAGCEKVRTEIKELVKSKKLAKAIGKRACTLFETVRWTHQEDGEKAEVYDPLTNLKIEQAFLTGESSIKLLRGEEIKIKFETMKAVKVTDGSMTQVKRELIAPKNSILDLPSNWSPTADSSRYTSVTLSPNGAEYKKVKRLFERGKGESHSIVKIDRIQNRELYWKYAVHKQTMQRRLEATGVPIERELFHGTSEAAVDSISRYGFNRSYSGKNGASHGQGVYFAVSSAYSASYQYSTPNVKGEKFMFVAKVLTGESTTLCDKSCRVPPTNPRTKELFDSVVDNLERKQMFVIFSDTQASPAYLIVFK